jgi:multiple antibiotic resistance protein
MNSQSINSLGAVTFAMQAFVTLFVIMDPPGATPIFLGLVGEKTPRERVRLAWQAAGVSFFVIASFAVFGQFILDYMNVSIEALQAAGGLLLLYVSLQLLTGTSKGGAEKESSNIGMVPLGTPLLAGPGAIVATMIYVQKADTTAQIVGLAIAILAVHIIIGIVLSASTKIVHLIKDAGVTLLASIAGLLLAAIAVQMLANAIKTFIAS